jgi:hypothetical protein
LPTFDETTLFLMSATGILLLLTSPELRAELSDVLSAGPNETTPLLIGACIGMALSIYHAFSPGEKDVFSKTVMASFAVVANASAAFMVGFDQLSGRVAGGWWPATINIGAAVLLIYQVGIFEGDCVDDANATPTDLLVGLAALLVVFGYLALVQKQPWPLTFSLCVSYSTLVHNKAVAVTREVRARVTSRRST